MKKSLAFLCIIATILSGCANISTDNETTAESEVISTQDTSSQETVSSQDTSEAMTNVTEDSQSSEAEENEKTEETFEESSEAQNDETSSSDTSPTAQEVSDNMHLGINLGNTFEAYDATNCESITYEWMPIVGDNQVSDYENCWGGGHITQETIDGMKEAGFDTVRIPVFWGNMMENDGTWTINEDYIARVREVVDYATNAGMYAVINIHHFDEFIIRRYDTDEACEIFDTLWTQIAEYFKDCPYTVIFEGYNEYLGGEVFNENGKLVDLDDETAYDLTNRCNQTFVDAVRATGGNNADRVLIVSGLWTNIDKTTDERFVMPTDTVDDRLMVSVHYIDNSMYWSGQIGSQEWLDYIDDQCDKLDEAFISKGIPVFVGETTAMYYQDNYYLYDDSSECLDVLLNEIYDRGYVAVLWTTGNDYYDRKSCSMNSSAEVQKHAAVIQSIAERWQ